MVKTLAVSVLLALTISTIRAQFGRGGLNIGGGNGGFSLGGGGGLTSNGIINRGGGGGSFSGGNFGRNSGGLSGLLSRISGVTGGGGQQFGQNQFTGGTSGRQFGGNDPFGRNQLGTNQFGGGGQFGGINNNQFTGGNQAGGVNQFRGGDQIGGGNQFRGGNQIGGGNQFGGGSQVNQGPVITTRTFSDNNGGPVVTSNTVSRNSGDFDQFDPNFPNAIGGSSAGFEPFPDNNFLDQNLGSGNSQLGNNQIGNNNNIFPNDSPDFGNGGGFSGGGSFNQGPANIDGTITQERGVITILATISGGGPPPHVFQWTVQQPNGSFITYDAGQGDSDPVVPGNGFQATTARLRITEPADIEREIKLRVTSDPELGNTWSISKMWVAEPTRQRKGNNGVVDVAPDAAQQINGGSAGDPPIAIDPTDLPRRRGTRPPSK